MPDEQNGQDAQNTQSSGATSGTQSAADQQQGRIEDLPAWAQTLIRETRAEAAERRLALKKQEEAAAAAEQQRLAEQGKYKDLYETEKRQRETLAPYQDRAAKLEEAISKNNQLLIQQIPEASRVAVPKLPPEELAEWLAVSMPILNRKPAPETDAGAGQGGGPKQPVATPQQQAMASVAKDLGYNISPEALAKRKAEMAQQRRRTPEKDEE